MFAKKIVLVIVLVIVLASCAVVPPGVKTVDQMNPQEKAVWMMGVYNSQYADYMSVNGFALNAEGSWEEVREVNLTDEQKEVLRKKRQMLTDAYPLITTYEALVASGKVPDREAEQQIVDLLNQMQGY